MADLCTCCQREVEEVRLREGRAAAAELAAKLEPECNRVCPDCHQRIRCDGDHLCRVEQEESAQNWSAYRDVVA